ncbi:MAG: metallophosphoesterase family protein [Deltaproteobacteria bacterium]|nr:metallophosphoesterase family protein [Deltaproteobacteria bacterium]
MRSDIFWIGIGDVHERIDNVRKIPNLSDAQAVLIAGDLTNVGGKAETLRILDEVGKINTCIYAQIGNMDTPAVAAVLTEKKINAHARIIDLGHGIGLMGLGFSSPTPFHTPSEVSEAQLARWLNDAYRDAEKFSNLILMAHDPPHGTKTDRLASGKPVGNRAVRRFIEDRQPAVCLTGHIHEAKSIDRLGRTWIVNPGLFALGGYAVIRLDGDGLTVALGQAG